MICTYLPFHIAFVSYMSYLAVSNQELRKNQYQIDYDYFAKSVKEYVKIYNYTLDQRSLINAVTFMYSPWSDPNNHTLIRQGLIDVRTRCRAMVTD